jgi:hypothetical protein
MSIIAALAIVPVVVVVVVVTVVVTVVVVVAMPASISTPLYRPLDKLVEFAPVQPHPAALRTVVDLDPESLDSVQPDMAHRTVHFLLLSLIDERVTVMVIMHAFLVAAAIKQIIQFQ